MAEQQKAIFAALAAITAHVAKVGIEKDKQSEQAGRFWYRGIDDVTSVLATPLAENKVLIVPSYTDAVVVERLTKSGSWYISSVLGTFRLTSLVDGSEIVVGPVPGEAGDSGDKSMSKACSVSMRNAMLQTFCAPIGPEADPENDDQPEPKAKADVGKTATENNAKPSKKPKPPVKGEPGTGIVGLTESQQNLLARKRDMAGLTQVQLLEMFPSIGLHNINDVFAQLKLLADTQ